jgi:ELWxxDGT repeat protein
MNARVRRVVLVLAVALIEVVPLGAQPFARLVADLNPEAESFDPPSYSAIFRGFQPAGERTLFLAYQQVGAECSLWTSDGTGVGTRLLADLCIDPSEDNPSANTGPVASDGRIAYYRDNHLRLWRSDGTEDGTFLLSGEARAPFASSPRLTPDGHWLLFHDVSGTLTAFRGRTYFVLGDFEKGLALWSADPRRGDPRKVLDLCPGGCGETAVASLRLAGGASSSATPEPGSGGSRAPTRSRSAWLPSAARPSSRTA